MANLFQSMGIFSDFSDFFLPVLLVFGVVYAVLVKSEFLSKNNNINMLVAGTISLLVGFSGAAEFISTLTPYLSVLFIIGFLITLIFIFFGVPTKEFSGMWTEHKGYTIMVVVLCAILVFYAMGRMYGPSLSGLTETQKAIVTEEGEEIVVEGTIPLPGPTTCDFASISGSQALGCIMGNPKFLGVVIMIGLLAIAAYFLTYTEDKKK